MPVRESEGQRNIEALRRIHDAFKEAGTGRVIEAFRESKSPGEAASRVPELTEVLSLIDEGVEIDARHGAAVFGRGGQWHGLQEWFEFWRDWLEPWEDFDYETSNFEAIGPHVVMDLLIKGRGRDSGVSVEWQQTQIWTFRDGQVILMRPGYETRAAAIEAVPE